MQDVQAWLPKVMPGGTIIMDDVGWTEGQAYTVRPAAMYLLGHGCETDNAMADYLILRKVAA